MAEATGIPVGELGLFTDLYQLTMAQSYLEHDKNRPATFSLIVRKFPPEHAYLVAAGLTTVLEYLEQVRFSSGALTYLRQTGRFSEAFLGYLATWRFQGDVVAVPEGSVFFCNEPVLEVTAPIVDAQLVESFIVNAVHLQTLIATKAARCTVCDRPSPPGRVVSASGGWHGVSSPRERGARNLTTRGRNRLASAVSGHPCDVVLRRRSAYGSAYP